MTEFLFLTLQFLYLYACCLDFNMMLSYFIMYPCFIPIFKGNTFKILPSNTMHILFFAAILSNLGSFCSQFLKSFYCDKELYFINNFFLDLCSFHLYSWQHKQLTKMFNLHSFDENKFSPLFPHFCRRIFPRAESPWQGSNIIGCRTKMESQIKQHKNLSPNLATIGDLCPMYEFSDVIHSYTYSNPG